MCQNPEAPQFRTISCPTHLSTCKGCSYLCRIKSMRLWLGLQKRAKRLTSFDYSWLRAMLMTHFNQLVGKGLRIWHELRYWYQLYIIVWLNKVINSSTLHWGCHDQRTDPSAVNLWVWPCDRALCMKLLVMLPDRTGCSHKRMLSSLSPLGSCCSTPLWKDI